MHKISIILTTEGTTIHTTFKLIDYSINILYSDYDSKFMLDDSRQITPGNPGAIIMSDVHAVLKGMTNDEDHNENREVNATPLGYCSSSTETFHEK